MSASPPTFTNGSTSGLTKRIFKAATRPRNRKAAARTSPFFRAPTLLFRDRIAAEPLHERALLAQLLQRGLHRRVLVVAGDVEEEDVVPRLQAARARLDAREVELAAVEGLERVQQRAGLVVERD